MADIGISGSISDQRKRHFREVVEYALERVSTGGQRASQRQLAERIMCAPGMIRRYLDMETSVEGLKFLTLYSLSKACRLDPGTLFIWIEEGREPAMLHEAALSGTIPPFGALDLARQLVRILEQDDRGGEEAAGDGPAPPSLDPVRLRLAALENEVGALFERMVRLTEAEQAIEVVAASGSQPSSLADEDWVALGRLLEMEPDQLKGECRLGMAVA